ncbi:ABC transporter G family member 41-like isoform X1 [Iris pallida]|uniref:ABC transporter G family member 41-like isoform X1 n=1 Tax=Iris pallida TaxID=29817 RepID=A0AAX6DR60_IRIPA|nr:ABC transporter G family member 41-like isoform X1 [Iris pallida]
MEETRRSTSSSSIRSSPSSFRRIDSNEAELQWTEIDQDRGREGEGEGGGDNNELRFGNRRVFIDSLVKNVEEDNRRLLERVRERLDRVKVKFPTVEVRYQNLSVEATCGVVNGKPLPTLWNATKSIFYGFARAFGYKEEEVKISIIKDASGIIKPSRMTLLLGPPGCGKTTLLLALAGKLSQPLKSQVIRAISYNGFKLEEFVPERTSAYVSQHDLHIPEMTVRETLDFAARFQGVGSREDIMSEVILQEKQAGIVPDFEIDAYMKGISVAGLQKSLQTYYIIKILGLDMCSDTIAGDAMKRGISGGQKKRLTTGEMIVGPYRALFMDEISNGLDSSTTFQIVSCIQQFVHISEATALISLLQPAPETFSLFDDIILMAEGKIIYHGPRDRILEFFEECGFRCPERKGIADFLQEVISKKDQSQYWYQKDQQYVYVTADELSLKFKESNIGKKHEEELARPFAKSQSHKKALAFSTYSLTKWDLLKTCTEREILLMKRESYIYVFKIIQLVIIAFITMTAFLRTLMDMNLVHASYFMGSLDYSLMRLMTNGIAELTMSISRRPIIYKQRDCNFYPAWAYTIPSCILKIPISLVESFIWTAITYYVIGYSPEARRFFQQFLLLFALHLASTSLFRFLASLSRTRVAATLAGQLSLSISMIFGGLILPRTSIPAWLGWGFWLSPMTYAEIGIMNNEFQAPRWQKMTSESITVGQEILRGRQLDFQGYFYWLSVAALFGFTLLFNICYTLALTYLKNSGTPKLILSKQQVLMRKAEEGSGTKEELKNKPSEVPPESAARRGSIAIPFKPLTITFQDVSYFIETPQKMGEPSSTKNRLQLLHGITGAFRPGILTALMGVSGAGKTTLMDVLCGRKTGGIIEGDIRIGGYPKVQETFARISGYCEQNDIHSPQITVKESVQFSAWLRLPSQIDQQTQAEFVKEVIEMVELTKIEDSLVGIQGINGLSTEQRKRLTIAVELVANPSIIFMDEPTSGLDARSAAIVMRAVKNIGNSGRTVVCTIHQPSINIFESFDELFLMKAGGRIIYSGPLGRNSIKLVGRTKGICGVPKMKDNCNPATWMLEVTSTSIEHQLGVDFASIFRKSTLYWDNQELVEQLSIPPSGSNDLHFLTLFPQENWGQFKACFWKQCLSYWRSPTYNLIRVMFTITMATLFGILFWKRGKKVNNEQDLFNILGSMFIATLFLGVNNCSCVLPIVARERNVLYREKFAGMYSSWAYSAAQVAIEIPYTFFLSVIFVVITYPTIGYYWSVYKAYWFFYSMFCTILYYNYLGMCIMSSSSTIQLASILASACYTMLNLFSGFLIPGPKIPRWWIWAYWICPTSWSLKGMLTSQYGDINKEITAFGENKPLCAFLEDYYGFHHNQLYMVAIVLAFFPVVFASLFAYNMGRLNFQRR